MGGGAYNTVTEKFREQHIHRCSIQRIVVHPSAARGLAQSAVPRLAEYLSVPIQRAEHMSVPFQSPHLRSMMKRTLLYFLISRTTE